MGVRADTGSRRTDRGREGIRVALHVRSLSPGGCREHQNAVIDRLRALRSRGTIDEFDVRVWGTAIPVDGPVATTETGRAALRRVARFERWARDANVSLAIDTYEGASTVTGERHGAVRLPTMTLAEFRGDDLRCIAPHTADGTTCSVSDRLDALEGVENPTEGVHGRVGHAASAVGGTSE